MKEHARLWRLVLATAIGLGLVAVAVGAVACGGSSTGSGGSGNSMADTIVGAGATFPFPLYTKWGSEYASAGSGKLNYQGIGSGGGIAAVSGGTVDFGGSDAPLAQADLTSAGLVQWPQCVGGVVPVVNLTGVSDGQLRLTADVLAKIYNGDITTWNDPAITAINPGLKLPATQISVVHRSDSSGTTWIFTNYLQAAAPSVWTVGADKTVNWPTGVGGTGNDGVAALVSQGSGRIGYVEYAYALQAKMTTVQMQNKAGAYVKPSLQSFASAASQADWTASMPSMYMVLVNQPGKNTWPITGASFILMQKNQNDAGRAQAALGFFDWAFKNGSASAQSLDYVPIPKSVYSLVENDVWKNITVSGTPVWQQ